MGGALVVSLTDSENDLSIIAFFYFTCRFISLVHSSVLRLFVTVFSVTPYFSSTSYILGRLGYLYIEHAALRP